MNPNERKERGGIFHKAAPHYDAVRPGYPEALFQTLNAYTNPLPPGLCLEIGCGTGQATLPMATLGRPTLCLEPHLLKIDIKSNQSP